MSEKMPELSKWPPRIELRLPRDWQEQVIQIGTTLDPYEEMARQAEKAGPVDVSILLELLEGADIMGDKFVENFRTLATETYARNNKTYTDSIKRGQTPRSAKNDLRQRSYLSQEYLKNLSTQRPLLRRVTQETRLLMKLQLIEELMRSEQQTFANTQSFIDANYKDDLLRYVLTNIVHVKRFDATQEFLGSAHKIESPKNETRSLVELYRDVDLIHRAADRQVTMPFNLGALFPVEAVIKLDSTITPWRIGTVAFRPQDSEGDTNITIQASISRFGGHICPSGFLLTPMSTFMKSSEVYDSMHYAVWRGIHSAFEQGLVIERPIPTSDATAEPSPNNSPIIEPVITQSLPQKSPEKKSPTLPHLPWMSYRQYTQFLRACGAAIVSGGKHLRAEYEGKSVSALNTHRADKMIPPAELQAKLDYLGIKPEVYIAKLPGHLAKAYKKPSGL